MKSKYIVAGFIAAAALGTGIYYHREIHGWTHAAPMAKHAREQRVRKTPELQRLLEQLQRRYSGASLEQVAEEYQQLRNNVVMFAYQHSNEIVAGRYDPQLERIQQQFRNMFAPLERKGRQELERLYGQLGSKFYDTLFGFRRELCQPEIEKLSNDIEGVINNYMTETQRQRRASRQTEAALGTLSMEERGRIATRLLDQMDATTYQNLLRQKPLEFWMDKIRVTYGVELTRSGGHQ